MKRFLGSLAVFAILGAMPAAQAATCDAYIDSVPYTIATSGNYCLRHSVTLSVPGYAVTINASGVKLDLQGFSIYSSQRPATFTSAVYAYKVDNITIRNGRIRGFTEGIYLWSTNGFTANNLVEKMIVRQVYQWGIVVNGGNSIIQDNVVSGMNALYSPSNFIIGIQGGGGTVTVRNNRVDDILGSGAAGGLGAEGIVVTDAPSSTIADNTVSDVASGADKAIGILFRCSPNAPTPTCGTSTISGNEVLNSSGTTGTGIDIYGYNTGAAVNVINNDVENFRLGISYSQSGGFYMKNVVAGAGVPYTGGIPRGINDTEL